MYFLFIYKNKKMSDFTGDLGSNVSQTQNEEEKV
jgi:hypothetical protein